MQSQGRCYIVARPNETFSVHITLHGVPEANRLCPGLDAHYFATCEIDGRSVGHITQMRARAAASGAQLPKKLRTEEYTYDCDFSYTLLGVRRD